MKKSFISILLLTIVMMLAISVVSATEDIDASDLTIQSLDTTPVDEVGADYDVLKTSDDAGLMADNEGENNFTSLQNLVDSEDEIILEKNYIRVDDDKDVVIDKSVKIIGDGIKIDANGLGRIFNVTENGVLTLNGITLVNGSSNLGGAIYNSGTANIDNCMFMNNDALIGGAIYIYSTGVVDLTNSRFNDNNASTYGKDIYNEGKLSIANNVLNVSDIYNLGEIKNSTDLKIFAFVDNYGCIIINATIDKKATGNVTYKIFSSHGLLMGVKEVPIEDGIIEQYSELTPFAKGNYTIVVSYTGDENYSDKEVKSTIEVTKSLVNVSHTAVVSGGEVNVTVDLGVDATGMIHVVYPSGYVEDVAIVDGKANFDAIFMHETGYLSLVVDYDGDENYFGFYEYYIDFFIKYDSNLTVSSVVNKYGMIIIEANVNSSATGEITFVIYNSADDVVVNVTKVVEDGAASFDELCSFDKGFYTFEVEYSGDDLFESAVYGIGEVNVTKSLVNVTHTAVVSGGEVNVTVDLGVDATGVIHVVYPSGYVDNVTIVNGKANFYEVFIKETGDISLVVDYDGDENYFGFYEYYINFIIQKATFINAKSISVVYQNNAKWTINLIDADNKPVTNVYISVSVNGKNYKAKTNSDGKAVVTIPAKFVPKVYATKITFDGTTYYASDYENSLKFTVKKATPKLTAKKKTFKVKNSKKYTVTLKTNKNKALNKVKVTITIKAKSKKIKITRTTKNGKATFNLKKLTIKGRFTALVKFAGNKYYNAVSKKAIITVR